MHPVDLETLIDRELRQLPMPRAPHTLLPRVLAAVQEWTLRPWYARAWFTWPFEWQVASVTALTVLVVCSAMLLPTVQAAAAPAASTFAARVMGDVAGIAEGVEMTTRAARVVWRALVEPFLMYAFALVALMCLACLVFGTVLNHVVLERAIPR